LWSVWASCWIAWSFVDLFICSGVSGIPVASFIFISWRSGVRVSSSRLYSVFSSMLFSQPYSCAFLRSSYVSDICCCSMVGFVSMVIARVFRVYWLMWHCVSWAVWLICWRVWVRDWVGNMVFVF